MREAVDFYQGKIAVVTGAASGIGAALCEKLHELGTHVVAVDLSMNKLQEPLATLREKSNRFDFFKADVSSLDAMQALKEYVDNAFGRIDLLFNNAGVGLAGDVADLDLSDWQRVFNVNVYGAVHGVHVFYPMMIQQGSGHIVNMASGAGLCPRPGMAAYAASKSALIGLSLSLRVEAETHGVGVCVVCPGFIRTGILHATTYKAYAGEDMRKTIPIKPISAAKCAGKILNQVKKNKALIPIGKMVWLEWLLFRVSPGLGSRIAALRYKKMQAFKISKT